jgi:hypothetical protein
MVAFVSYLNGTVFGLDLMCSFHYGETGYFGVVAVPGADLIPDKL